MQPFHMMNMKTQCQRSPSLWVVGGELSSAPGGQSGKGKESRGSLTGCSGVAAGPAQLPGVKKHEVDKSVASLL